jgi:hypothetical protein
MMQRFLIPCLIVTICFPGFQNKAVYAQLSKWDFGGYAKNLLTYAKGDIEDWPVEFGNWQNTTQLRLNLFYYPTAGFTASAQVRNLLIYQQDYRSVRQFQDSLSTDSYFFDLRVAWLDENDVYGFNEIDRLYLNWSKHDWNVTLGRQRIVWGTCLVWNPTDLFNPFDILDFDYAERPGTDALQVNYYTGPVSQLDLAITPGETSFKQIYAGRYMMNRWNYDFAVLAGRQRNSTRLGVNWAGQLFDGGFRGEILYTNPDMTYTTFNPGAVSSDSLFEQKQVKDPFLTFALSFDYTFKSSFYIHTEYIYNGLGTTGKAGSRRFDVFYTGELTPARQSVFQEFSYQLSPLLRGNFFIIFNPNDKSWIAAPSVQYSLATNLEMFLLAFPSGGSQGTEYGGFPAQYFARLKYSF